MSKDRTNQKGITLIALVITIIVMLILVGVSVTVALNGGLFSTAKEAAEGTATKRNEELNLSDGKVEINGKEYNSIDEYVNGSENGNTEYTEYSIGDEVIVEGESFYVIADSDKTQEKVTLLAKDCIDTTNLVQSASANYTAFSGTNYWSSTEYPLNLNDYPLPEGLPEEIILAKTTAKEYGVKIGGTGRLMTKEEADTLNTEAYRDILYGINGKSSSNYLMYWLGSANDNRGVCVVAGLGESFHSEVCSEATYGLRPVVEISKANIS